MKVTKAILAAASLLLPVSVARADDAAPAADSNAPPPGWWDTVTWGGHLEAGITGNTRDPNDGVNFGHLFTDKANTPLLNQLLLTVWRPIDISKPDYDFGFKLQGMIGSDARYTHFLGELDSIAHKSPIQYDVVEAFATMHTPWLTAGGIDFKAGQFVTLEGAEVIDVTGDFFHSHSYIFNFGIPFKHTGIMSTIHVIPELDLMAGITSGVNTSLASGDNNNSPSFHGGIGLNLLDGKLTVAATTHIGPENSDNPIFRALNPTIDPNRDLRYLNDITTTVKLTDDLTSITDLNYVRDDGFDVAGYGVAQYLIYNINDWLAAGIRGEFWRDEQGFFVCQFGNNSDFDKIEKGDINNLNPRTVCGGRTTYTGWTAGLNIKPPLPGELSAFNGFMIRPEVRFDSSLSGTKPFIDSTKTSQVTIATDVIIPF